MRRARPIDVTARRRRALAELSKQGLEMARELSDRLRTARSTDEVIKLSLAFERVSREIREAIVQERELARERRPAPEPPTATEAEAPAPAPKRNVH